MKKFLMSVAALALLLVVGMGAAQACTSHGLVQAATLDAIYGSTAADAGVTFTFDADSYSVVGPDGTALTYNVVLDDDPANTGLYNAISPNLTEINNYIQGFLGETQVNLSESVTTEVVEETFQEIVSEYDG